MMSPFCVARPSSLVLDASPIFVSGCIDDVWLGKPDFSKDHRPVSRPVGSDGHPGPAVGRSRSFTLAALPGRWLGMCSLFLLQPVAGACALPSCTLDLSHTRACSGVGVLGVVELLPCQPLYGTFRTFNNDNGAWPSGHCADTYKLYGFSKQLQCPEPRNEKHARQRY